VEHETTTPLHVGGRWWWPTPDGGLLPVIAGASNDAGGDAGGDDGDGGGGQDDGDGGTIPRPGGTRGTAGTAGDEPDEPPEAWPDDAKKLFRKLRKIADDARRDARTAQDALQQRQTAGMTEAERQAARIRELEGELGRKGELLKLRTKQEAFREAGNAAKAKSPSTLYRFIDDEAVEWGPDGEILNAPELVAELKRSESWMFEPRSARGSADAAQGVGQQAAQQQSDASDVMNRWIRGAAGRS
jgi:hypothetical protein